MRFHLTTLTRAALGIVSELAISGFDRGPGPQIMKVTATAYTLREAEAKKGSIGLAAWGDQLKPGMKAITVSRDLIEDGLDHITKVKIEGLEGTSTVRDEVNKHWEKRRYFHGQER